MRELRGILIVTAAATLAGITVAQAGGPGHVVFIRDFSPRDLPGLQVWYAANAITGLSDGNSVANWKDRSGNGFDVNQPSGPNQPIYKVGVANSLPVVRFSSAAAQYLANSGGIGIAGNANFSYFTVFKPTDTSTAMSPLGGGSSGTMDGTFGVILSCGAPCGGAAGIISSAYAGGQSSNFSGGYASNAFQLVSQVKTAGALNTTDALFYNGSAQGFYNAGASSTPAIVNINFSVGRWADNSYYFNGDIAEVIVYSTALSPANRMKVECYLSRKYALAIPNCAGAPNSVSGLTAWYAADQIPALSNASSVSTWNDLSGNGNDVSQASGPAQPKYESNVLNGKPTVRFNGTNTSLQAASNVFDMTKPMSVFAVAMANGAQDAQIVTTMNNTQGALLRFKNNGGTAQVRYYSSTALDLNSGIPWGSFALYDATNTGTNSVAGTANLFANGAFLGSIAMSETASQDQNLTLGAQNGGYFLNGDIAEVAIYNRALSTTERQQVEEYFLNKYGPGMGLQVPQTVSGLALMLRGDLGVTMAGTGVTGWADQSGNKQNASQPSAGNQPTYNSSNSLFNNQPTLTFNGSVLNNSTLSSVSASSGATQFVVARMATINSNQVAFEAGVGPIQGTQIFGGSLYVYAGAGNQASSPFASTAPFLLDSVFDGNQNGNGTRLIDYLAGVQQSLAYSSTVPSALAVDNGYSVGATSTLIAPWVGDIAEVLLYNRALSNSERAKVECYLSNRYSLNLPNCFTASTISGLAAWYAADNLSLSDGQAVSTWSDLSGNNLGVTQPSGPQQPVYKANILNGKPVVRFNGSSTNLVSSSSLSLTGGFTLLVVAKNRVRKNYNGVVALAPNINIQADMELYWQAGSTDAGSGNFLITTNRPTSMSNLNRTDSLPAVGSFYLETMTNNNVAMTDRQNGVDRTAGDSNAVVAGCAPTAANPVILGVLPSFLGYLDGDIAEVLIYNRALSTAEIIQVEGYLNGKYGLY